MKFGYLPISRLSDVDLSLPADNPFTTETLKKVKKPKPLQALVGCAKWNQTPWIGKIYPKGSKAGDFLKLYGQRFNAVELNTMYYGFKDEKDLIDWNLKTPDDFVFCPKFLSEITHDKELKDVESLTDKFIAHFGPIRAKLGHFLLQLEDGFSPAQSEELLAFLETYSGEIPIALELRNKNWFNGAGEPQEIFEKLRKLNVPAVICDTPGRRDCIHQTLTTSTAFIRFNGTDLDQRCLQRLDDWAERIKNWQFQGLEKLYFFIHNEEEVHSPALVAHLIEKLNQKCGLSLTVPRLYMDQTSLF